MAYNSVQDEEGDIGDHAEENTGDTNSYCLASSKSILVERGISFQVPCHCQVATPSFLKIVWSFQFSGIAKGDLKVETIGEMENVDKEKK